MKPPELIAVYNICGIGGKENLAKYFKNIRNLLDQHDIDFRLVISACQNTNADLRHLAMEFGARISYWITQENLTVNQTFNEACRLAAKEFGMPKGFLYVDSGCNVAADTLKLKRLLENHESGPYAMTAALTDTDTGFDLWRPGIPESQLFANGVYVIPIGQTCNLHFQIFDKSLVEAFGKPMPDVFRDFCTESIFSFMCASVNKRFAVWINVRVIHDHGMDGGAAGFPGERGWKSFLPGAPRSAEEIVNDPEAKLCGMGYEECEGVLMHDPALYDSDGVVANPGRLRTFIKDNFFLPETSIDGVWIPQGKKFLMYDLPKEPFIPNISDITGAGDVVGWMSRNNIGSNLLIVQLPVAPAISNYSLDGIYIDGERDYRVLLETMDAWWCKVKRIGIMSGADFQSPGFKYTPAKDDSRNAIQRWTEERNLKYHVCQDGTWITLKRW